MRIRTRLFVFALVSVLLVCAAGYLGIANGRRVRDTQRETVINSGPVIQQLETLKFSGLRIISAATDYGLFRLEDPIRNAGHLRDEESEILDATRDLDAAKLLLESRREIDHVLRDLLAYIAPVTPNRDLPKGWQHLVVALPNSPAGTTVRQLLEPALAEAPNTFLESEGEIVLCYEVANLPLQQTAELFIGPEGPLADAVRQMLTRNDIAWSTLALARQ